MSDRRYTAIFGAAVLTASVATFSVYRLLSAAAEPVREPTRAVVVLAADVPAGVAVPREALTQVPWPARVIPPEALTSPDSVAGRVTRVALTRGEPVRASALAPRGAAPGLEGTIAADRRAIAVRVSEAAGVSGLVRPDSRVDVLVTSRGENGLPPAARLVMSDVRVLGVGPARAGDAKAAEGRDPLPLSVASIVTLEVTPAQAAELAAAEGLGTVQVVLRGFGSHSAPDAQLAVAPAPPMAWPSVPPPASGPRTATAWRGRSRPAAGASEVAEAPEGMVRPVRAAPVQRVIAPAARTPAAQAPPDSVTVRVYRGGVLTLLRVEASAPARPTALTPSPAAPSDLRTAALGAP